MMAGEATASVSHGSISVIGRRRSMEDAVTVAPKLVVPGSGVAAYDFFGVYDGHGGSHVVMKCKERMHQVVAAEAAAADIGEREEGYWERVMRASFERVEEEEAAVEMEGEEAAGATAVVVVVGKEEVVVANCGDCRAVLCRGGAALALSRDHKPEREDERARVEAAGGRVVHWNGFRVLGVLATSRSIGDYYLKPYVISEPEVTVYKRSVSDDFLIIASDGLWDVVSNDFACDFVNKCFHGQLKKKLFEGVCSGGGCTVVAATLLAELAIARGSRDNISIIIVELRRSNDGSS